MEELDHGSVCRKTGVSPEAEMDVVTGAELECSYGAGDGWTRSGVVSMPKERSGGPRLDWSCDWEKYGYVKSGSTLVRGPVKSGQKRTRDKGRGLDKELVQPELVTAWIQRLRTMSIDPLHRFRSRGWRWRQRQRQTETGVVTMVDFRLRSTG